MSSPVMQALMHARMQEASPFGRWCFVNGLQALPVTPANVAAFVRYFASIAPVEKIGEALQEVSRAHVSNGFADPTAGGPVAEAMNEIANIDPPRGWPKAEKARFKSLPYDLQIFCAAHEKLREKEIHRAHDEAAAVRQALAKIQKPAKVTDGNIEPHTAAA